VRDGQCLGHFISSPLDQLRHRSLVSSNGVPMRATMRCVKLINLQSIASPRPDAFVECPLTKFVNLVSKLR
jgi:hypothetical protein